MGQGNINTGNLSARPVSIDWKNKEPSLESETQGTTDKANKETESNKSTKSLILKKQQGYIVHYSTT
jgi:hypothetical protein